MVSPLRRTMVDKLAQSEVLTQDWNKARNHGAYRSAIMTPRLNNLELLKALNLLGPIFVC